MAINHEKPKWRFGYPIPQEIRDKISKANKGKVSWLKGKKGYKNRGSFKKGNNLGRKFWALRQV